jgi:peptidyl-prolyl cis-trans isomerase C
MVLFEYVNLKQLLKEKDVGDNRMILKYFGVLGAFLVLVAAVDVQAQPAAADKVLAKVGDQVITETDLKEMTSSSPDKSLQTAEGQAKALDYLVNIYVLAGAAQNEGLEKDPEVQRYLKFNRNDLLARVFLEKKSKNLPAPTDKEAKDYFEKNRDQFTLPESILLHHILVKTEQEAKDALARLKKGEKFADVASQISICPSRAKGGNLDWLPKGSLVKEIEDVAFTMKNGEVKGPVQSKFGFHVLYLEDKKPAQESSFDQVQAQIVERLKFQAQQDNYEKLAKELRQKMNVQVMLPAGDPAKPALPAAPATK